MKSATKRGNQIVVGSITLLVALTAVLAYLNAGDLALKKELEMNAEFLFTAGETSERVSMSQILELQPVEFEAVMDTSITDPTPVTFTGVELSWICQHFGIELLPDSLVQVSALDGYASVVTGAEALEPGNVYICIAMNGEALKPKSQGGFGPFMMVIKNVVFSQRWCKFVEEIVVR